MRSATRCSRSARCCFELDIALLDAIQHFVELFVEEANFVLGALCARMV